MRFLTDQDVYHITVQWLRAEGDDVVTAAELGLSRASDQALLGEAHRLRRLLVTRDKDFGALVFVRRLDHTGVILLRMTPANAANVHQQMAWMLSCHCESDLRGCFCVIEDGRHRLRRLPWLHTPAQ